MATIGQTIGQIPTFAQVDAVVSATIAGYWQLTGNVNDGSGNANDLNDTDAFLQSWVNPAVPAAWIGGADTAIDRVYRAATATALQIDGDVTIFGMFNGVRDITPTGTTNEVYLALLTTAAAQTGAAVRYGVSWRDEGGFGLVFSNGAGVATVTAVETVRMVPGAPFLWLVRKSGTTVTLYVNDPTTPIFSGTAAAATGNGTGTDFYTGVSDAQHGGCIAGLGVLNSAISTSEIAALFNLYRLSVTTEFTPTRVTMGASVAIDWNLGEVFVKDPAAATVNFTISNPKLHRVRTVAIRDTVGGGSLTVPATVTWVFGESPADVDGGVFTANRKYLMQLYCDDETTPHFWGTFRKED